MKPIDIDTAALILDLSGGDKQLEPLARLQLEGAVALQNMLVNPDVGFAYLADEVGMGKTYVALAAVALMRYFNPSFRVLYICPSRNVQEKWHEREYPNFIKKNVITRNFNIRTPQGESGTPSIACANIRELINAATTGYYGDVFVRMSSFSVAMGDGDNETDKHMAWLRQQVPASVLPRGKMSKKGVKEAYAKAINYLLPKFDLVVIDEAHNFKHDFASSARNTVLSKVLGFNAEEGGGYRPRAKNALLLSATPFDVDPHHLFNQLNLVGKGRLLPDRQGRPDKSRLKKAMAGFMVRRLNELNIVEVPHTRNMYRREWRKGERAEIGFETDEHKLVTALVQKKVGEMLTKPGSNPAFQLGLLASFESYAQTSKTGPVEFDGENRQEQKSDAQDRHVIAGIRDSYVESGFGQSLPHPKMDQVSRDLGEQAFRLARKQLVFVRRVKSVGELKQKLDDEYNDWLFLHIKAVLAQHVEPSGFFDKVKAVYDEVRKQRDDDITGGDAVTTSEYDEERVLPKNDTLFNWFFRGEVPSDLQHALGAGQNRWQLPDPLRNSLASKNNANVLLFEFNWASWAASSLFDQPLETLLEEIDQQELDDALQSIPGVPEDDVISLFLSVQKTLLNMFADKSSGKFPALKEIAAYLSPLIRKGDYRLTSMESARPYIFARTFFHHLARTGLQESLFSSPSRLAAEVARQNRNIFEEIHRVEIHRQLVAQTFRTGHPFVDLYLARLRIGAAELNDERRQVWLHEICLLLEEQLGNEGFSSAVELSRLNENLDLVIKSNLSGVHAKGQAELRQWLNNRLPSNAPVIGANGETSANRSVQARKFRMPGYPLVLVSTDVFQEGEDLHTFCDSVVHYGLSSSPVSIEQKTGRVDRVGAFAHRRLLAASNATDVCDDDYIQVRFPFVKQSIEAVQVRVLCTNLNTFVGSLHEIGGDGSSMEEFVNTSVELASRNEIPDQLLSFLESPYIPPVSKKPNKALRKQVIDDNAHYAKAVKQITELVEQAIASPLGRVEFAEGRFEGMCFNVQLTSARSSGEMLLRVTDEQKLDFDAVRNWSGERILENQSKHWSENVHRTYCVRESDGLAIYRDAEMLVGDASITCENDIQGLFQRFDNSTGSGACRSAVIDELNDDDVNKYLSTRFHWNGHFSSKKRRHGIDVTFHFNDDRQRKHHIRVRQSGGYCALEATVSAWSEVRRFSANRLLELTWMRNRNIDLVEFIVNPEGDLVGRAFHPLASMNFEEFIFSAYVLAVEADRLEYLIKEPDEY